MVGRTEVNRATNLGRLDSYKQSKMVKSVIFITAGDNRVCSQCEEREGMIASVDAGMDIIPVHVMCRCTWEVHEYYNNIDARDSKLAFQVDTMDKVTNTAPVTVLSNVNMASSTARYKKHLAKHGIDTPEGYKKVYDKLSSQLTGRTNVFELNGWDYKKIEHLHALHQIKNSRLYMFRDAALRKKLLKNSTSYNYERVFRNDPLAYAATDLRAKHGTRATYITSRGIKGSRKAEDFFNTISHEAGHNVYHDAVSRDLRREWVQLHLDSKLKRNFVSTYAKTSFEEDFVESVAYYLRAPEKLKRASAAKFTFLQQNVFKGI